MTLNDPDFDTLIDVKLIELQQRINTAIPCVVTAVHTDSVDIKLNIKREFDGVSQPPLKLPNVPINYPGSGQYNITFPIVEGDTGIALFMQRDIDRWLKSKTRKPATPRMHDYSDAIFIPGLRVSGNTKMPDKLTLSSGNAHITLDEQGNYIVNNGNINVIEVRRDGVVSIHNGDYQVFMLRANGQMQIGNGQYNLISILQDLLRVLSTTTTVPFTQHSPTTPTPEALSSTPELIEIMNKLKTF